MLADFSSVHVVGPERASLEVSNNSDALIFAKYSIQGSFSKRQFYSLNMIIGSPGRSRTCVPWTKTRDDGPLHYGTSGVGQKPLGFDLDALRL